MAFRITVARHLQPTFWRNFNGIIRIDTETDHKMPREVGDFLIFDDVKFTYCEYLF